LRSAAVAALVGLDHHVTAIAAVAARWPPRGRNFRHAASQRSCLAVARAGLDADPVYEVHVLDPADFRSFCARESARCGFHQM
jgi:hypothetical protein